MGAAPSQVFSEEVLELGLEPQKMTPLRADVSCHPQRVPFSLELTVAFHL